MVSALVYLLVASLLFLVRHTLMVSIEDSVAGKSFASGAVAFLILVLDISQMFLIMTALMRVWSALT